jgi:hypothetical protein
VSIFRVEVSKYISQNSGVKMEWLYNDLDLNHFNPEDGGTVFLWNIDTIDLATTQCYNLEDYNINLGYQFLVLISVIRVQNVG